jgi:hypothetical protein
MSRTIYGDLLAAIQEHSGLERESIIDAANHGADSGFGGFTYYSDTSEFVSTYRGLVWQLLDQDAEEFGFDSVPAFVASFNRADLANDEAGFDCLVSWYVLESVGRWLEDHAEEIRAEEEEALRESGKAAGRAAGSWVSDGNSSEEHCREVLRQIEEWEFEIPSALSGEFAGGWDPEKVFEDADVQRPEDPDAESELLDVWEDAYREGYEEQAAEDARGFLPAEDEPAENLGEQIPQHRCESCSVELNPAAVMVYGVDGPCGACTRKLHEEACR